MSKDFSADPDDAIKWMSEQMNQERDMKEFWEGKANKHKAEIAALRKEVERLEVKYRARGNKGAAIGLRGSGLQLFTTDCLSVADNLRAILNRAEPEKGENK